MTSAQTGAVLTWAYAAGFGVPVVHVAPYLLRNGRLPTFFGMFPRYGGPWSSRVGTRTFGALAMAWKSLE